MEWKYKIYLVHSGFAIEHTLIQIHDDSYAFYLNELSKEPIRVRKDDSIFLIRMDALKFLRARARNKVRYWNAEIKMEKAVMNDKKL